MKPHFSFHFTPSALAATIVAGISVVSIASAQFAGVFTSPTQSFNAQVQLCIQEFQLSPLHPGAGLNLSACIRRAIRLYLIDNGNHSSAMSSMSSGGTSNSSISHSSVSSGSGSSVHSSLSSTGSSLHSSSVTSSGSNVSHSSVSSGSGSSFNSSSVHSSGSSQTSTASGTVAAVSITNTAFVPSTLTVQKGTAVTWTNTGSGYQTVTHDFFSSGGPASSFLSTNQSYTYQFNNPGMYSYHSILHTNMQGSVTVNP